ncbi:MAG: hypothetical protein K0B16_01635 [Burkholderiaceae bacterium]|nr:hypothetical protein [Burkholderiaceae bacterium]
MANRDTYAFIDDGAHVEAKGDVEVRADAVANALEFNFAVAGGFVGAGLPVDVMVLNSTTEAYIGDDAASYATGAVVDAGGSVLVSANSETDAFTIVGGIAGGAVGVTGSVTVLSLNKDTNASIGNYATVDAKGAGAGFAGVSDGTLDDSTGAFGRETRNGVIVQAESREDVFVIGASAGAGAVGVSAAVTVQSFDSDTTAAIGGHAKINQTGGNAGANAAQSVTVSALNDTESFIFTGGFAGGAVGAGGAVNVGIVRNDTAATIGEYAAVTAAKNVDVNALANRDLEAVAIAAAGGAVGLAGSVAVWSLGDSVNSGYAVEQRDDSGNPTTAKTSSAYKSSDLTSASAQAESSSAQFGSALNEFDDGSSSSTPPTSKTDRSAYEQERVAQLAIGGINSNNPAGTSASAFSASGEAAKSGTVASIQTGAVVSAGDDVGVRAKERLEFTLFGGSFSGGSAAAGAGIAIVNIGSKVEAFIGDATVTAGAQTDDTVTVRADFVTDITGQAWGGQTGGVGLGAQVVVINDNSSQFAHVDSGADINRAGGSVLVKAKADRTIDAEAIGIQVAAAAAGASVAVVNVTGETRSWVNGDMGQSTGAVRDVEIAAESVADLTAYTLMGSLTGGFGLTGAVAAVDYAPTIKAETGAGSDIKATRNITVSATSTATADVDSDVAAISLGGGAGASIAISSVAPNLHTRVAGNLRTTGAGTVRLESNADVNAEADAFAIGGGLLVGAAGAIAVADSSPDAETELDGSINAAGAVEIDAQTINDAIANTAGYSGGLVGMGASLSYASVGGTTDAHSDGQVNAYSLDVTAGTTSTADAESYALAGGLFAGGFNTAQADVQAVAKARLTGASRTAVEEDVDVRAQSDNAAYAQGHGVTIGALAVGAMYVDASMGSTGVDEVYAGLENGARINDARFVTVSALGDNEVYAQGEAAGGGLITITGTLATTDTDQSTKVDVGGNSYISATSANLVSSNVLRQDTRSDSLSIGLAAGGGALADNTATGDARINIGAGAEITATNIVVSAKNVFDKEHFSTNLESATAAVAGLTALLSSTEVGTDSDAFEAKVSIGNGALLHSVGNNADPGLLRVEAFTDVAAVDKVEVEAYGIIGLTVGKSAVEIDSKATVDIDGGTVYANAGKVDLTARSNAYARTDTNTTIAVALTGAGGSYTETDIDARNNVRLNNATVKGRDVYLFAGRDSLGQVNIIDGYANSDLQTYSLLPTLNDPGARVVINERNDIDVLGTSKITSLENVTLRSIEGIGGDERGHETGGALSLSLVPYGINVDDNASTHSYNTVDIAATARVEAGVNNQTLVYIEPLKMNGTDYLAPKAPLTASQRTALEGGNSALMTDAQKTALGLDPDIAYEYAPLDLDAIPFSISTGTVVQVVAGANSGGIVGDYYQWKPISDSSVEITLEAENFANTSRWIHLSVDGSGNPIAQAYDDETHTYHDIDDPANVTVYQSNATSVIRNGLLNKFYVIKPVELDAPSIIYQNLGNVLLEQREKVLSWIANHSSDAEAVARYQVQLELIEDALEELGLTETVSGQTLVKRELDILFVKMPDMYAAPGSVFIEADSVPPTMVYSGTTANVLARAGAKIEVVNNTPFTMTVNDAVIRDTKVVTMLNGQYTVLNPGNVYFNNVALTGTGANLSAKEIKINQDKLNGTYDLGSLPPSTIDQDLYLVGDVINETGLVQVKNQEGSITVSGEIRGNPVEIYAAKDFTLNSDDWFHTGKDPRQMLDYDALRALVYSEAGTYAEQSWTSSSSVPGLDAAIAAPGASILAQGTIAITARYLNINGLIQSGAQNVELHVDSSFVPNSTGELLDTNGNPVTGVNFGSEKIPVKAYFDISQQAIVVDDIVPEGGRVILAGQILSTGGGQVVAAYGYASVDITNASNYKLIVNRIDTTKDRVGKITIIDTARIGTGAADAKTEYLMSAGGVTRTTYSGALATEVSGDDSFARINYTLTDTATGLSGTITYAPRAGLHYVWTEGQELTQTIITKYEQKKFNLVGGNTSFEDWVSKDNNYKWRKYEFTDPRPLLESEALTLETGTGGTDTPSFADGDAYGISYVRKSDTWVDLESGITTVYRNADGGTGGTVGNIYRYAGTTGEGYLPGEDYGDTGRWTDLGAGSPAGATYESSFENSTYTAREWTTGGGWLRNKTYHTEITETRGMKDYYTNVLKADYSIAIGFLGSGSSTINVSSKQDLLIQGNVTVANGGTVTLNSTNRSVLGGEGVAVFNDAPDVTAGKDVRLLVEGGVGVLNITAGGDIHVVGIADTNTSDLKLGQVVSTGGDTTLIARDGLEASNPATSLVKGNRVELSATGAGADIGGAGTLRIDSNILGAGGFAALAGGDIDVKEIAGDLKLIRALDFTTNASVEGGGSVTLRTQSGAILDATYELQQLINNNALTPQQLKMIDQLNGLVAIGTDSYGNPVFDTDPSNNISADSFKYPVSPGLYSYLYPHAEFLGMTPVQTAPEIMNVKGVSVLLIAEDGLGSIGRSEAAQVVNMTGGFAALTNDQKKLLATANASDVYGRQYGTYRYIGSDYVADGADLEHQNFGDSSKWQKISYIATGASKAAEINQSVAHDGYVLVEFNNGDYGLYQYLGSTGTLNLAGENYSDTNRWSKVEPSRSTDDTSPAALAANQLVLNKFELERVALQLQDDVDVDVSGNFEAYADGDLSVQTPGSLKIDNVRAGGDVLIVAGGNITDAYTDGFAAIGAFGDLTLISNGVIRGDGTHAGDPLRIALSDTSQLFVDAAGDVDLKQMSGDLTINGSTKAISDLYVARVTTPAHADIEVSLGDMIVERIDAGLGGRLVAQGSIIDANDDAAGPIVNVDTGDLYLKAGQNIGSAGNFFDVFVAGDLSGLLGNDAFINSPTTLNITTFESTNGDVTLTVDGATNIGLIKARQGTVDIVSQDSIVDRNDDASANIEAVSVDLESVAGAIGTTVNPFDIDTSYGGVLGTVNALALSTAYLIETSGNMRVDKVRSKTTNVWLKTLNGSILDANGALENNVTGVTINLEANHGDIGEVANALEIDSSNPEQGKLNAWAYNSSIYVTETAGAMYVGTVYAATGDVVLSVRDSAATGEDLIMDSAASISAPATSGGGDVLLQAGDNVHLQAGSTITSGRHLKVHSGYGDTGNVDATGTTLLVEGTLASNEIELAGERQADTITLRPDSLLGHVRVLGDTDGLAGGDDIIIVDHLPTMTALRDRLDDGSVTSVRDTVDLDGRGGTDTYTVLTHGSLSEGTHDYIVNVLDSGAKDDGLDTLNIDGSEDADVFLLRRVTALTEGFSVPVPGNTPAFVALMHGSVDDVRNQVRDDVERINYDENINSRLIVRSFGGDDFFAVDDNAALTTLDAGAGDDEVQIGQMYGAPRISVPADDDSATVAAGDDFATVETTVGYLSRGASFALTAYGGTGNDQFTVYSNKAETRLEGNDGNDVFVIRAFALADDSGFSTEAVTQAVGGGGNDTVMYNINAPVDLDGGAGFDKVVVIGTEKDDNFVITDEAVYGAGLNVRYLNMEALDVDGLEGDDHFFIRSTAVGVVTTIIGGKGSDTFDVAGDVTEDIVSLDLEGRSGVINHSMASADSAYGNLLVPGIGLNVASATGGPSGQIVVEQTDGSTVVNEQGETIDHYTIKLAGTPGQPVYINVSAARTTQEEEDGSPAGDSVLISLDKVTWSRYLTLTATDTSAQTIYVKAVDDGLSEGERIYAISHSAQSADTTFNHVPIKNVRVTVKDNDRPEVIVTGTGYRDLVLEGDATTQVTDTYTVQLGKPVASGTVVVTVTPDSQVTVSSTDTRYDSASHTITFDSTNWADPVTMTVTAVDDSKVENTLLASIQHTATGGYDGTNFKVKVVDNDRAGILIDQSDGNTIVVADDPATGADESVPDSYTVRLTKAPTDDVTVTMLPDNLTTTVPTTLTFTTTDWWIPQTVTVNAAKPQPPLPAQPLKTFPIEAHVVNSIAGPLYIEGYIDPTADRALKTAIMLPDEFDEPLPTIPDSGIDEDTLIDTLNIHNDSSGSDDVGVMDAGTWHSGNSIDGEFIASTNISGLDLSGDLSFGEEAFPGGKIFAAGITYRNIEVAEVLLGQGDDTFTINDTLSTVADHGGITIVHGGGNTSTSKGDTITITGSSSPLVVYGDTSQDGARYNGQSGVPSELGIVFDYAGNDTIDARASSQSVTIYGGAGDDTIWGSQAGDHLFGGSGDDEIHAQGGADHVYGDSGINVDVNTRVITVVQVNTSTLDDHDGLVAGSDTIYGDGGNDIVFGDHGQIDQAAGTLRILTTGAVTRIATVEPDNGAADTIYGGTGDDQILGGDEGDTISDEAGHNIVFGDHGVIDYVIVDGDLTDIDLIESLSTTQYGGADTITTLGGDDIVIGGRYGDTINAGDGSNLVIGDSGRITAANADTPHQLGNLPITLGVVETIEYDDGGNDTIVTGAGVDLVLGGYAADDIRLGANNDIAHGDNALLSYVKDGDAATLDLVQTLAYAIGGSDTIRGEAGEDVLIGGAYGDRLDGGSERDLIFGDNVDLDRTVGDGFANARYRTLSPESGGQIYATGLGEASGSVLVTADSQLIPGGAPVWEDFDILIRDHDTFNEGSSGNTRFGNDYIAGGAGNDQIFGQLGDDVIQGDGSIDLAVGAARLSDGTLLVQASVENLATDGDDYIEGNGGNDVIFGNLGQDDIIGGNSSLFSLDSPDRRSDASGEDMLFGGAGTDIARLNAGDETASGHANDSDMILGDNGNIYRLVSVGADGGTTFKQFNYDLASDRGDVRIVVRAADLLDYTQGGPDFDSAASADIGAGDEIHGESGDDFIYGMKGDDVIFGEGQDDDIVGGYGNDWISGGNGQDGVIGDDGRIFTSRNGTAEVLNGVIVASKQSSISTPGKIQQADLDVTGQLKKTVDLTPFSQDELWSGSADEFSGESKHTSDDIIYGGLGSDWLHGASGDDAISGAEALPGFYSNPVNPGNVLRYDPITTEFAEYDEYAPLARLENFLLNFDATEGVEQTSQTWGTVFSDGDDKIFGDNGNDWLVGGTGRDNIYGGWGNDLLNADDDQSTNDGANDAPDTHPSYEDRAYGGAGRDVLIANTGGDRLIDWVGEFNSFIVPFAPYGMGTVSRTLQPQLGEFLYALSASDGADFTRADDAGGDPLRNGEPEGELGMVRQQDPAWQDQTGAPRDIQAGNIPGGKRDVLRSATFNDPTQPLSGFAVDSGLWDVTKGALSVSARSPSGDAAAVLQIGDALPSYFEMKAAVKVIKPTAQWKANSYLIFDYIDKSDFKFAGIDASTNKLVIGHRDHTGWVVDVQTPFMAKPNQVYNLMLSINGLNATIIVDGKLSLTQTYSARIIDDWAFGLNWGLVGVGSDNARGTFDNIVVQMLAPEATTVKTDNFDDGPGESFTGQPSTGAWTAAGGRFAGTPATGEDSAVHLATLGAPSIQALSILGFDATLSTTGQGGFIFDRYDAENYKFVVIDAPADSIIIGHSSSKAGVVIDASVSRNIVAGRDYELSVMLKGTTVSVTLDGQAAVAFTYNAVAVDGRFGLISRGGTTSFDSVTLKTNDEAVANLANTIFAETTPSTVYTGDALVSSDLGPLVDEAIRRWSVANGESFAQSIGSAEIEIVDLPGLELGSYVDGRVLIDIDAAGYGWFIDPTPGDDSEFILSGDVLAAQGDSATGRIDLLSVLQHELGHVAGLGHVDDGLMATTLSAGVRTSLAPEDVSANDKPSHDRSIDPLVAPSFPTVPSIDWSKFYDSPAAGVVLPKALKAPAWQTDFVNNLARKGEPSNPNSILRIQIDAAPKVNSELSRLHSPIHQ